MKKKYLSTPGKFVAFLRNVIMKMNLGEWLVSEAARVGSWGESGEQILEKMAQG